MATSNITSTCLASRDFNITDLPSSIATAWTVVACVNGVAAPFTVVFNTMIIWTILGDHQLRSKSYNILLSALAVSDLLIGLVVQPLFSWYFVCLLTECESQCFLSLANTILGLLCTGLTLCTLMMLSVERYLAIQLPIFHRNHVTTRRVMIVAVCMWIAVPSNLLAFRILLNNSETFKNVPVLKFVLGNLLVTLYCTIKVNITAYFKTKVKVNPPDSSQQTNQEQDEQRKRQIDEYKRAFTMGFLVLISIIFYFPIIIVNIIQAVKGKEVTLEFKYIVPNISFTFIFLQSLVNPVVMSLRVKKIREKLKEKIMCSSN